MGNTTKQLTRYYFRFESTDDPDFTRKMIGDEVQEDSAIADTLDKAKAIMVKGYGPNVLTCLKLIKQEPITLFEPAEHFVNVPDDNLAFLDDFNTKLEQRIRTQLDPLLETLSHNMADD